MTERSSGASAVEFAILAPLLFMLIFGAITGGIAVYQKLAVENAGRDGARWAATLPAGVVPPADTWFADVAQRTVEAGAGALAGGTPERFICVAYVGNQVKSLTWENATQPPAADNATTSSDGCFTDALPSDQTRVQIRLQRQVRIDAIFVQGTPTVTVDSVTRFEAAAP